MKQRPMLAAVTLLVAACAATTQSGQPPQPSCGGIAQASLGCLQPTPTPPGGVSRDSAIAAARAGVPGGPSASVVWAHIESNPFARPNGSPVWEVRLAGGLREPACPSDWLDHVPTISDPPCLDRDSGLVVVLDYISGEFIGWLH